MSRAASHVLLVSPVDLRYNEETAGSNVFMRQTAPDEAARLARLAVDQHRRLRDLLVDNGVTVTVARGRAEAPDAPFCNNWFSTHTGGTVVLYPLLAPNRRRERRSDVVGLLRRWYHHVVDLTDREEQGRFLESTGSLCLDDVARTAYATRSPRTDPDLAAEWAKALGYRLVLFTATDERGTPYYHTNVMMFIGHRVAGVCLEAIHNAEEQTRVRESLEHAALTIVPLTRRQVSAYAGNCLPLSSDTGERLLLMSTTAYEALTADQRAIIERHARILHTDLTAFETLGGGSARCLLAELI